MLPRFAHSLPGVYTPQRFRGRRTRSPANTLGPTFFTLKGDTQMSLATLSPERRAADLMDMLRVRQDFVGAYCGIEATKLSRALKGTRDLSPEEGKRLVNDLTRLLEISHAITPFFV